jgi:DNA-binding MarR family transcriptional regulator
LPTTTGSARARTAADDPAVAGVEVELSLLARHHLTTSRHTPGRELDRSAYQLLGRLELGPLSLRQLAEAFRLDQSTVNRQVNALLRSGLVERVVDPEGGLARLLRPTRHGLAVLRRDRRVARAQVGRVLAGWSDRDVDGLRRLLEKFNSAIEALEGRPWPRHHR